MLSSSTAAEVEVEVEEEEATNLNRVSSFTSSKSSSSYPSVLIPRTMEEVWRNVNLGSIQNHSANPRRHSIIPHDPNFIVQDFFARSDPPTSANAEATSFTSMVPPPPATVLRLNSGPGFNFLDNSRLRSNLIPNSSKCNCLFRALTSSASVGSFVKKRAQDSDNDSGDQRYKKLIKNRESAARYRAKQKAYTKDLESEVQILKKENARLKRLKEQLCKAPAGQLNKKRKLERTSTAPF